jgi:hypothetical protein
MDVPGWPVRCLLVVTPTGDSHIRNLDIDERYCEQRSNAQEMELTAPSKALTLVFENPPLAAQDRPIGGARMSTIWRTTGSSPMVWLRPARPPPAEGHDESHTAPPGRNGDGECGKETSCEHDTSRRSAEPYV